MLLMLYDPGSRGPGRRPLCLCLQAPDTDCVYISGLSPQTTEQDLTDHFGSIGVIKMDKKAKKPKVRAPTHCAPLQQECQALCTR